MHHELRELALRLNLERDENNRQQTLAQALTLRDIESRDTEWPRLSQSLQVREAAAAAVGLRVLKREDLYPRTPEGAPLPAPPRFDSPDWCRRHAHDITDDAAKKLIDRFIDLVDACEVRWNVGPGDRVLYQSVLDLGSELNLVAQTARPSPAPVTVVAAVASGGVEPDSAVPGWGLKTIERSPGYRWPLYQALKAAHEAGKPCPKARDILEFWRLNPQADLEVMPDGVKFNNGVGKQKEANLKAIQQAIKNLVK